jgi:hypothetical protein
MGSSFRATVAELIDNGESNISILIRFLHFDSRPAFVIQAYNNIFKNERYKTLYRNPTLDALLEDQQRDDGLFEKEALFSWLIDQSRSLDQPDVGVS